MSGPARILVCDDDPQILRAVKVVLRDAGFEPLGADTGEEALDRAAVHPPQAAIIDLMLPGIDGVEVCRQLRQWSEMPIIVLSAMDDEATKILALQTGADDYVTKPFAPGELVARVRAALRRAGSTADDPVVRAAGLTVELAARRVRVDDDEVHLTPTEYDLLTTLVRNRGRLLTHRSLLTQVWGPEYADATGVLRTHIANLRAKIESPEHRGRLIRTDSGVGYRFTG